MLRATVPVFHVADSRRAEEFYCDKLGFSLESVHRTDGGEPSYMWVSRDNVHLHLSSFSGDAVAGGVVMVLVDDVDLLFDELASKGVKFDPEPVDQSWGNREMYAKDPDGNTVRFFMRADLA